LIAATGATTGVRFRNIPIHPMTPVSSPAAATHLEVIPDRSGAQADRTKKVLKQSSPRNSPRVNRGPPHQSEHHADGAEQAAVKCQEHGAGVRPPERQVGSDSGGHPEEGEETIERPGGSPRSPRRQQGRQHRAGGAIQDGWIVEPGSEIGEDRHEADGRQNERDAPHANADRNFHIPPGRWQTRHLAPGGWRRHSAGQPAILRMRRQQRREKTRRLGNRRKS
jgi:hypothetical protein